MGYTAKQYKKLKLLLVGGGHGHVYVLKQLQKMSWPHVEVALLSPSRFQYYSGMFAGFVEGLYSLEQIRIDLAKLASRAGIKWVPGSAVKIDPHLQIVFTDQGETLDYDMVSFDIGSLTSGEEISGVAEYAEVIKPTHVLPQVLQRLATPNKIVVVGGGASGIELSLAIHARRRKDGQPACVKLVSAGHLLHDYGGSVSEKTANIIRSKGVDLCLNCRVKTVEPHYLVTASGNRIPFDAIIWLAGPRAHSVFRESGLGVDEQGYLMVNPTLQAIDFPNIFGIGDCISIAGYPQLAKAGVYAVRESPILWHNILSYTLEKTPRIYHPQVDFLSILSTGGQQALLLYKGTAWHGKWVWRLKKQIDTSFMRKYQC